MTVMDPGMVLEMRVVTAWFMINPAAFLEVPRVPNAIFDAAVCQNRQSYRRREPKMYRIDKPPIKTS